MLICFAFCFDNLFLFKTRRTKHDLDLTFNTNVQAGFVNLLATVCRGVVIIVRILALVIQKTDNAIHWINCYPAKKS